MDAAGGRTSAGRLLHNTTTPTTTPPINNTSHSNNTTHSNTSQSNNTSQSKSSSRGRKGPTMPHSQTSAAVRRFRQRFDSTASLSSDDLRRAQLQHSLDGTALHCRIGTGVFLPFTPTTTTTNTTTTATTTTTTTTIHNMMLKCGEATLLGALTRGLVGTYRICNPAFAYTSSHNPRRVLTRPSHPLKNDGFDNQDSDYILYVGDILGDQEGKKYRIVDLLGQGTFGQVAKCQNIKTHQLVAVKIIKNKPAYFQQSMMEFTILDMLNNRYDPHDRYNVIRMLDHFIFRKHLCIVFEMLSLNLYELIRHNKFRGISPKLVRGFVAQILEALSLLNQAKIIHCDLKPENVLLRTTELPECKVIDFGSACHEQQTVYTYIQSRFYRAPEILLGLPYTSSIDMWSLGCIAAELFLGLPIFPGSSEYNQISRILEMLGPPPSYMLDLGKNAKNYFDRRPTPSGKYEWVFKSIEQYNAERNATEKPSKRYFAARSLPELILTYPSHKKWNTDADVERERQHRLCFIDFLSGLLAVNPLERWSPNQAKMHPYITGERWTGPFTPPMEYRRVSSRPTSASRPTFTPSSTPTTAPLPSHSAKAPTTSSSMGDEPLTPASIQDPPIRHRPRANTITAYTGLFVPPQLQRMASNQLSINTTRYPTQKKQPGGGSAFFNGGGGSSSGSGGVGANALIHDSNGRLYRTMSGSNQNVMSNEQSETVLLGMNSNGGGYAQQQQQQPPQLSPSMVYQQKLPQQQQPGLGGPVVDQNNMAQDFGQMSLNVGHQPGAGGHNMNNGTDLDVLAAAGAAAARKNRSMSVSNQPPPMSWYGGILGADPAHPAVFSSGDVPLGTEDDANEPLSSPSSYAHPQSQQQQQQQQLPQRYGPPTSPYQTQQQQQVRNAMSMNSLGQIQEHAPLQYMNQLRDVAMAGPSGFESGMFQQDVNNGGAGSGVGMGSQQSIPQRSPPGSRYHSQPGFNRRLSDGSPAGLHAFSTGAGTGGQKTATFHGFPVRRNDSVGSAKHRKSETFHLVSQQVSSPPQLQTLHHHLSGSADGQHHPRSLSGGAPRSHPNLYRRQTSQSFSGQGSPVPALGALGSSHIRGSFRQSPNLNPQWAASPQQPGSASSSVASSPRTLPRSELSPYYGFGSLATASHSHTSSQHTIPLGVNLASPATDYGTYGMDPVTSPYSGSFGAQSPHTPEGYYGGYQQPPAQPGQAWSSPTMSPPPPLSTQQQQQNQQLPNQSISGSADMIDQAQPPLSPHIQIEMEPHPPPTTSSNSSLSGKGSHGRSTRYSLHSDNNPHNKR